MLLWLAPTVASAALETAYLAEVPVQDQSPEQRNRAIEQALGVVLARLYGGEAVTEQPAMAEVVKQAPRLVRQYRFRTDAVGSAEPRQMLVVQFDEAAVNRVLREKNLAPGDAAAPAREGRPAPVPASPPARAGERATLLWLATERSGQRELATPETDSRLVSAASTAARDQGLPVMFPLYDLEDRSQVTLADLWGLRAASIQAASRRYATDRAVVGLVSGTDATGWTGRWALIGPQGMAGEWTSRGTSTAAVVQSGIAQAAERSGGSAPAQRSSPAAAGPSAPAPSPASAQAPASAVTTLPAAGAVSALPSSEGQRSGPTGGLVAVRVAGVQRLEDYLRTRQFLSGLAGIRQVSVLGVAGDSVVFGVGPGAPDAVSRAITGGNLLSADTGASAAPGGPPGMLRYRLGP
jgi:hypothetical protein